jgi:hypothetical protein
VYILIQVKATSTSNDDKNDQKNDIKNGVSTDVTINPTSTVSTESSEVTSTPGTCHDYGLHF